MYIHSDRDILHTVIHIGNHKTGSTSLQRSFFPKIQSRRYIGSPFEFKSELHELFERIKYQNLLSYNTTRASELYNKLKTSGISSVTQSCESKFSNFVM